jgi:peptidyl-prolyl cis-trans isomerase D
LPAVRFIIRSCALWARKNLDFRRLAGNTARPAQAVRQQTGKIVMLDAMRRGVTNLFTKLLLGLLVIAFAVWGIGDVIRTSSNSAIATVGKTAISPDEFRQAYQDEMASISRRLGRKLTAEQAKILGVEARALSRLIGFASLDLHAKALGLAVSDNIVATVVRGDQAFQEAGQFSPTKFRQLISQLGYVSEGQYVQARRRDIMREQLTETLGSGLVPQATLLGALHRYREETRVIEYVAPDYDKLIKKAEPSEAQLREHHQQNLRQYIALEQRKAKLLLLSRAQALSRTPVTDEEVKAAYEASKDTYNIPEKRKISQLTFPDKAAAEKAYAELSKAKNFNEAAEKLGFPAADTDLGVLTRAEMIDPKIAEAAFGLKLNELSQPLQGQFSVALVRVTEIQAGKQRSFDEVKPEITERLANERVTVKLGELHDKAEAERAKGVALKDIGEQLKLPFSEIAEITRLGKSGDGKVVIDHPDAGRIAEAIFEAQPGVETDTLDLSDGGYAWFELVSVTPERQKAFEEVKADVLAHYLEAEKRKEMVALAAKQVVRLEAGEKIDAIAKDLAGAKVERSAPLKRSDAAPSGLPSAAMQEAFSLPKGGASQVATADGRAQVIIRVADVIPAGPATAEQAAKLRADVANQMRIDLLEQYVAGLRTRYGFTVNEKVLKEALGPQPEQPADTSDD